ncbi:endonuclease/exonuclease/phosphatase family protein [Curtobacterium sp. PhB115]|uniref:endonuclease/exonuclease/phosphatase family protein n=1 Tax=Curtobacterium sp. PhB115 TaxID=2485173 RepID=UPI000F4CDA0E|nr:endonuclease/exonuclease/phosphatase family protein [Curtobacterium sp. PhB115]ROP80659.1 endonuclease/exonuclease/phosphatase family metal-dependent hydrolase [Curtobacterium sp. PhB115]
MSTAERPITLMTYNIKNPDPAHDWPARLPVVLDVIRRHDPDLLCVQEAFAHQMDDLRAGLPGHADLGQGREGGTAGEYAAVFYRRDRFRPADEGSFWLSDTPDEPVSNTWESLYPRIANHARFLDAEGAAFTVVTTHLDHELGAHGDEVRGKSAALIVERLAGDTGPVVFAGDCNEPAGTGTASRVFAEAGFSDAWVVAGDPDDRTATFNDWEPPVDSRERIDWVLTRGISGVDRVVIDHDGPETWFASDHFPVVATLRI